MIQIRSHRGREEAYTMRVLFAVLLSVAMIGAAFGGDAPAKAFSFSGGINLGSDVFMSGPDDVGGNPTPETWTRLGFQPDLGFGKIGVGIDLTFHFKLYPTPDTALELYEGDWIPQGDKNVLDVYLPKILYVRYGLKGEDPFFVKLGSISDLSLGNGFIMSDYSNMHFMPQQRIFGLDIGLDGALFKFPYAGLELLTGNLARFDVFGARVFARPLVGTSLPILKDAQAGVSFAADRTPYEKGGTILKAGSADAVAVFGGDVTVPIVGGKAFPLAAFTELAFEPNGSFGWMIGLGGRLVGIFTYGAQFRLLQDGFIPSYFDANYDLYSAQKYDFMQLDAGSGLYAGWLASLGTSLFEDVLAFKASLDGPFEAAPAGSTDQVDYPHLRSVLRLDQLGSFPFFFDASYEKYRLGAEDGFLQDLVDPTDAVIGLSVNYKTGASVLTLIYDAKWDPAAGEFVVTSSLQASMKF
jgi:hypothetical protein